MIFTYTFFQNALLGSLLASVLCGIVGTYVVTRRMVIVGGGMAHASLGGVGMGVYFGFSPLVGAALFALVSGLGIEALSRRGRVREDSAIAMLWTFGMSLGILLAYLTPGFMTDLPAYLFGDILAVTYSDLLLIGLLAIAAVAGFQLFGATLLCVAYDRDFARSRGLPVVAVETVMTALTALTIVSCLHMVGIVLVVSLLSVPQLTASLLVRSFRGMVWLSAVFGFAGCAAGIFLSYYANVPCGAAIILSAIAIYALLRTIKSLLARFKIRNMASPHPHS